MKADLLRGLDERNTQLSSVLVFTYNALLWALLNYQMDYALPLFRVTTESDFVDESLSRIVIHSRYRE